MIVLEIASEKHVKLAVKKVLCKILWILCLPCAAVVVVLDGGFYVLCPQIRRIL